MRTGRKKSVIKTNLIARRLGAATVCCALVAAVAAVAAVASAPADAKGDREPKQLVVAPRSSDGPKTIAIGDANSPKPLLEFVDFVPLREASDDDVTVRYGRIDVDRFKAVLNGKDVTGDFSPGEGKRETVRLALMPGINELVVEVAPAHEKMAEANQAKLAIHVKHDGPSVKMQTRQGHSDDTGAKLRLQELMRRSRAGDAEASAQLQYELKSLEALSQERTE